MRILILGCGGIGGTVAACLERAGADVTAVTGNDGIARALVRDGYRVDEFQGVSWSVRPRRAPLVALAPAPASDADRFDVCVVATQSTRLDAALAAARPHLRDDAAVVCCQNGLPEERAAACVGAERVVGCVVGWGASMVEPGRYQRTSSSRGVLTLGRPLVGAGSGGGVADAARVANLLEGASATVVVDDLRAVRWSKLAINCVTSPMGAITGLRLGAMLRHRFVRRVALEVFAEVAAVARAEGVRPAPVAGTLDIERIAITPAERALRLGSPSLAYKHSILLAVGVKYRRMRSSMLYAIERGRPPEIDYLNGEVVTRGDRHGVPVPTNRALVRAVKRVAAGETSRSLALLRAIYDELGVPSADLRAAA